MPLTISDETLQAMKMDEQQARIEIACRFFDAEKLTFHAAARMTGLDRIHFENELFARGIAIYRPTVEDIQQDVEALRRMGI